MERGRGGESYCESDEKLLRQKNKQKVFNIKTEVFSLTFIALIFRTVFDSKQIRQTEEGVFIVKTPDVYISRHMDKIGNPSYLHLLFFLHVADALSKAIYKSICQKKQKQQYITVGTLRMSIVSSAEPLQLLG